MENNLLKILKVVNLQLDRLEAQLIEEKLKKVEIERQYSDVIQQLQFIATSTMEDSAADPAIFRYKQMRLRKLVCDLEDLKPERARSYAATASIENKVKATMRKRLGLQLQISKILAEKPHNDVEMERLTALFHITTRV
ncbi:hypothetical protein ACG74X_15185 [Marivita sp. S0852]|uniref:hypothetical protein n=1 Tax=Marivita sp. S0852 TaxID=3373893 RepID=UPI003982B6AC